MLKATLIYFAGVLSLAAVSFAADGKATVIGAITGLAITGTAIFAGVSSRKRIRRLAAFLASLADALDRRLPAASSPAQAVQDPRERDLVSALRNWGASRKQATGAARAAIRAANPGDNLQALLPAALQYVRGGRAA